MIIKKYKENTIQYSIFTNSLTKQSLTSVSLVKTPNNKIVDKGIFLHL